MLFFFGESMQQAVNFISFPHFFSEKKKFSLSLLFLIEEIVASLEKIQSLLFLIEKNGHEKLIQKKLDEVALLNLNSYLKILDVNMSLESGIHPNLRKEKRKAALEKLFTKIRSLFFSLSKKIIKMNEDENILLQLLKHKARLNDFLGPFTIEKLLQKMFSNRYDTLFEGIQEKLFKRGFSFLFKQNVHLFSEMKQESPWKDCN